MRSTFKGCSASTSLLNELIDVSLNRQKADLVIKNGQYLDVFSGQFIKGDIAVYQGMIAGVFDHYEGQREIDVRNAYIVPGFIDAHLHIESTLLIPEQLERLVLPRGTTTLVWDPHEIANVIGTEGIQWALQSSEGLLLDIFVMLSSCVPATTPALGFETSGAILSAEDLKPFISHPRVLGLAELMNLPGLFNHDPDVIAKIQLFHTLKIDGHCPATKGYSLNACGVAAINTCHESVSREEAAEKLSKGIHVLIRQGSCERNASELLPLLNAYTSSVMAFCTDDLKPNDIVQEGHIDAIINKGLKMGIAPELMFRAASFAPSRMYDLEDRGAIAPGYWADFCVVLPRENEWKKGMEVQSVYKRGQCVEDRLFKQGKQKTKSLPANSMNLERCSVGDFRVPARVDKEEVVWVIGVQEHQIVTDKIKAVLPVEKGEIQIDPINDILKIAVLERHHHTGNRSVGFVKGFKLRQGALASTIAHDSHNIVVVGVDERSMMKAVNHLIDINGGIVVIDQQGNPVSLSLPIGGLMTDDAFEGVLEAIDKTKSAAKAIGCELKEPFLQLAFLALPVVPSLKITDTGLIDVDHFKKVEIYA